MLEELSPNQRLVLDKISKLGQASQNQILQLANISKHFSQSYVSAILKQLEKRSLIKVKLSGVGHEKLYSVKESAQVKQNQAPTVVQHNGIIYPAELLPIPRMRERPQTITLIRPELVQVQAQTQNYRQDEGPIIYEGYSVRKAIKVLDPAYSYNPQTGKMEQLWHWE